MIADQHEGFICFSVFGMIEVLPGLLAQSVEHVTLDLRVMGLIT